MTGIKVYISQEVQNSDGKRIFYKKRVSRSFTLQFLDIISAMMNHSYGGAVPGEAAVDTGNAARTLHTTSTVANSLSSEAPAGTTTYGIVFGTGTNAENGADYALQTLIAEGAGAGQLNYGGTAVTTATQAGGITSFTIIRAGANNSGGNITVEETGLYVSHRDDGAIQRYFCVLRDLTGGVLVSNAQTYTVTYTIQTSI